MSDLSNEIFYHGSPETNITKFICSEDDKNPQTFFTKVFKYAEQYTLDWDTGEPTGIVYKVKLNIKNPLYIHSADGKELIKQLVISDLSEVEMTDELYKYLKKTSGKVMINNEIKTFDGLVSSEELTSNYIKEYGLEANNCYLPLYSDQIKIIDKLDVNKDDIKESFIILKRAEMLTEKIVKKGNKYQVQSEKGRNMGTYDSLKKAKKRLQQIEYFKHMNESENDNIKLYFISQKPLNNLTLRPRIPNNYMTKHGFEDNSTERVCFSTSIDGCLMAMSDDIANKMFYVYTPSHDITYYSPSISEVPDVKLTDEKWVTKNVTVELNKIIVVSSAINKPYEYTYGDNKKASLYKWNYSVLKEFKLNTPELLYHVSENLLDDIMHPEIPKSDHEEQITPRICFAKMIQGCLIGAFEDKDLTGKVLHVYSTVSDYYQPTEDEVADVKATGEVWITHDVEPKYEYDIKITGKDGSKTYNFDGNDFEVPTWKYEKVIEEDFENNIEFKLLHDKEFYKLLDNSKIENKRFSKEQFLKNKSHNDGYYCLINNNQILSAALIIKNKLHCNDTYINELQTLKKGYGRQLLKTIFNKVSKVWLMAEPGNDALINYYSQFNMLETILPADQSIYGIDTYYFSNFKLDLSDLEQLYGLTEDYDNNKVNEQSNIYITGVQGSGKTTYAERLSKELNLPVVHLDDVDNIFFDDEVKESDPLIAKFFNSINPEILKGTQADFKKYGISNGKKIHKFFTDLLRFLEDNGPVIVEGLQILDLLDVIDTTKNKVILIDKPFDKTITQLYKREKNNIKAGNFRINDRAVKDFDDLKASMDYSWADDAIKQLRADTNVEVITESMDYDPPYNKEQIKKNYGIDLYQKLIKDPAHKWRMETGIELIHKEPSFKELKRIWYNWQLMSTKQKEESDKKSMELFGCTNEEHYYNLLPEYNTNEILTEATRNQLILKSRKAIGYKDPSKGSRWLRKNKCSVANTVANYNKIDMDTFWKKDILKLGVGVKGETSNYVVTVEFTGVLEKLKNNITANKNMLTIDVIYKTLLTALNSSDNVKIGCQCPDFKYRFQAWATKNNYNAVSPQEQEAKITNPKDNLGSACKHVLCVLNNGAWLKKVASVINNYVIYCKDKMEVNYKRYIFPKLYGMTSAEAERKIEDNTLPSDEATINLANALGKIRGRINKGSNKNPVAQKRKDTEKSEQDNK